MVASVPTTLAVRAVSSAVVPAPLSAVRSTTGVTLKVIVFAL